MRKIDLTDFQVATSETARQINRRIALSFIRRFPPMSRADLARRSGLQRSTVSAIVDQLIGEGWVTEAVGRAPRGRRPRLLHLNADRAGILAVDLRPERTTIGLGAVDARFVEQTSWPTPAEPTVFVKHLARTVAAFRAAHPRIECDGIGVSLPGRVDRGGRLVFAPNLRWGPVDLQALIETAIGLPAAVENAANACALAELWFGRHPEHVRNLLAVTVSEGIGVGLLLNGQLVHGQGSLAGEFGHVTLHDDGPPCPCGRRGCWERYASNSAAVVHYLAATGGDPAAAHHLTFEDLLRLAERGDSHADETLRRMSHMLGVGLAGLVTGLAPELIVIIGEITRAWDHYGPVIVDTIARRTPSISATRIIPTDPALEPRLRGAATLVIQRHFAAPQIA